MKITLHVWRQPSTTADGRLVTYQLDVVTPDMSFLEMFDMLNEQLIEQNQEPVDWHSRFHSGVEETSTYAVCCTCDHSCACSAGLPHAPGTCCCCESGSHQLGLCMQ